MAERGPGWLYALQNPLHPPDLLKIGLTTRLPEERAAELSAATGVPMPYVVAHKAYVLDCGLAEDWMRSTLNKCRVARNREFFRINLEDYARMVCIMLEADPNLLPSVAEKIAGNDNCEADWHSAVVTPKLTAHEFKGTPTWVTIDSKQRPEVAPPGRSRSHPLLSGRPWVPPWIKQ
ncbi:MAG: GIY-YIG nuclease family protein [Alphaproteobacteria bacterium]